MFPKFPGEDRRTAGHPIIGLVKRKDARPQRAGISSLRISAKGGWSWLNSRPFQGSNICTRSSPSAT